MPVPQPHMQMVAVPAMQYAPWGMGMLPVAMAAARVHWKISSCHEEARFMAGCGKEKVNFKQEPYFFEANHIPSARQSVHISVCCKPRPCHTSRCSWRPTILPCSGPCLTRSGVLQHGSTDRGFLLGVLLATSATKVVEIVCKLVRQAVPPIRVAGITSTALALIA